MSYHIMPFDNIIPLRTEISWKGKWQLTLFVLYETAFGERTSMLCKQCLFHSAIITIQYWVSMMEMFI
jgi:hypothetical protein